MRPARIELWYDSAAEQDGRRRDIEDVLASLRHRTSPARACWRTGSRRRRWRRSSVQRYDTGTNAARSAGLIGSILGFLFFPAFICGMSAAVDCHRRRARTALAGSADGAAGAHLGTGRSANGWPPAALAIAGITLELMLAHAILSWLPLEEIGMSWRVSWGDLALVCLASVPLSLFAAGLQIAVAMNARSFKEAQSVLSFVTLVPLLPGMVVSMLELKTATWMYLVPMLSNQTLLRETAKGGDLGVLPFVLTFACSAAGRRCWRSRFASWRMKSERYVLASSGRW